MQDQEKPDLDESVNVTESHGQVLRDAGAVSREKHVDEGGREPISLWIFGSCAVILIAAGLALGNAGAIFDYEQTVRPGYQRRPDPSAGAGGAEPVAALKAYTSKGAKIYGKCIGCHGPSGDGAGAYPSLAGSDWVTGDSERLAMIILNGLSGPTSTGKEFGVMPAQGIGMSAADLAALMTFVRNSFGNESGDVVTQEMAAEAIKISEARSSAGAPVNKAELDSEHNKDLPGEPLAPDTQVDPVTLAPVEEEA